MSNDTRPAALPAGFVPDGRIRVGVRFPDYEVPIEPGAVKAFVQAVEGLGFDHVTHFDHIAGMSDWTRPHWRAPYSYRDPFGEVLTMFTFMAAVTERIGFMTAVLVLPLRQTALVAKQVGTLDVLSGGRLRLGVGIGWNDVEYELLGARFEERASVLEEQVDLLRRFWTEELVTFRGEWHRARAVGMQPLPVQRPVPIWMAPGLRSTPRALRRAARLADGILPLWMPDDVAAANLDRLRSEAVAIGRDPATIGIEPNVDLGRSDLPAGAYHGAEVLRPKTDEELEREIRAWVELGATHLELKTRDCGLAGVDAHVEALARCADVVTAVLG